MRPVKPVGEPWTGKTALAKIIARRGGNEGAFGGLLLLFSRKRRCVKNGKWRQLLSDAGLKFDENDFSFKKKGSLSVSWEPVELPVEFPAANRLRVRVTEATKDFKLTVRGFDANRDLRVIPHSEEQKEEADGAEL